MHWNSYQDELNQTSFSLAMITICAYYKYIYGGYHIWTILYHLEYGSDKIV